MKNLKVSMKLIISFMILTVFAVAVGVIGLVGMNNINAADDKLYQENVVAVSILGNIRETFQDQRVQLRNYVIHGGDSAKIQEFQNTMTALENDIDSYFMVYEGTVTDVARESAYFNAKRIYQNEFTTLKKGIADASLVSFEAGYDALFEPRALAIVNSIVDSFDDSMNDNDKWAVEKVKANEGLFMNMLVIEMVVLIITLIVAVFLALYISGLIGKPLAVISSFMNKAGSTGDISLNPDEVEQIKKYSQTKDEIGQTIAGSSTFISHVANIAKELEGVADGDLTTEIKTLSPADIMGQSLINMTNHLNEMFRDIKSSSSQMASGSKQVADGAQSLAQGTTEQAASIQELSSTMSDIAASTKANASTADKASKLSGSIKDNAEKGSRQMDEMITAVKGINDASQSIGKIIKTIDDIAFQTNILALNAAVEAARAGQHGKGFAVVAEEVRNLASKSAEAAKDTGVMIQNSIERAEFGSRIAGETAASLSDIVQGINESSNLIDEIARASEEQSVNISQINTAIDQVAQVVQQNSATAEESAAASEEMSGQSDLLQQLIAQFRLYDNMGSSRLSSSADKPAARRIVMPKSEDMALSGPSQYSGDYGKY